MQSLWNDRDAAACHNDSLALRAYTSRLLGREPSLVLHGGGNTSVKAQLTNLFGEQEQVLLVKGSGWDLATITEAGFAPVRLDVLQRMAELPKLTDTDMVKAQRAAMLDPGAPTPSVEAILHAIIPFAWVDHTHADAVVTVTNTPEGGRRVREIYGDRVLIVPYVMPGFILARTVYEMTRKTDWRALDGLILLNHGVFTFGDDARASYELMIKLVGQAEDYLKANGKKKSSPSKAAAARPEALAQLARLRKAVSTARGSSMVARLDQGGEALEFASLPGVADLASRGPLTPDHVIRTKSKGMVVGQDPVASVQEYGARYEQYFARNRTAGLSALESAPRWAVLPGVGTIAFGGSAGEADIAADIVRHTCRAIQAAETLGGWMPLGEAELFEVEYWELEQAKLKKSGAPRPFQGKVAVVTGAASGIGKAVAEALHAAGAAVLGLDINPSIKTQFNQVGLAGGVCDVTDQAAVTAAVEKAVGLFGGLDLLVSNAGLFTPSSALADLDEATWQKSLALNLSSHRYLLQAATPYLKLGVDPAVLIIGSKNVPAPGPGAGAYSVAKAGLTQLARVAALELAGDGIRVNVMHPHAVFDTGAWTPEVLAQRARSYGVSVEEYKAKNLLKAEVTSADVAALALAMLGAPFAKTTGAQVPIDGGNDRVI
jgi:rhamnose utilization protein RhaD (predicted bifunctional aldolase and dehydrogenase)/NAD(P)-dependent dehydrogenase (short-subunit alcohol dehydrogenase family)